MGEEEMRSVGRWILEALRHPEDSATHERIRSEVRSLCDQFPVPAAALCEELAS
jgi:glycine hydroxymethyltransferase